MSFIRFQCILHGWGVVFSNFWSFCKLNRGELFSWGQPILQNGWNIWSPFLYLNFKSFKDPNSASLIIFQCTLHYSGVPFSGFWNFYKLRRGDLISVGKQFCRTAELFGPPFYVSILKVSRSQILQHSKDFNAFCMIQEYFSQSFQISKNLRWGT